MTTAEGAEAPARVGAQGWPRFWAQARAVVTIVLVIGAWLLWSGSGFAQPTIKLPIDALDVVLLTAATLGCATVGLLLTLHRPEVRIGRLEAWIGLLTGWNVFVWAYLAQASQPGWQGMPAAGWIALTAPVVVWPLGTAMEIVIGLLFPHDRWLSPRWSGVAVLAGASAVVVSLGSILRPGPVTFLGGDVNPLGASGWDGPALALQLLGTIGLGVSALLAAASLVQRYGAAGGQERAQIRIFAAFGVVLAIAFVPFAALLIDSTMDSKMDPTWQRLIMWLFFAVYAMGPLTIAVAIVRYRLYEIDHLVGRTFVYGTLTAILAGLYAAGVKLFQSLFKTPSGDTSVAAVVIATLILVTTLTPIKTRLEAIVARWTSEPAGQASQTLPVSYPTLDELREEIRAVVREELARGTESSPR